jgi:hypothetical protein
VVVADSLSDNQALTEEPLSVLSWFRPPPASSHTSIACWSIAAKSVGAFQVRAPGDWTRARLQQQRSLPPQAMDQPALADFVAVGAVSNR